MNHLRFFGSLPVSGLHKHNNDEAALLTKIKTPACTVIFTCFLAPGRVRNVVKHARDGHTHRDGLKMRVLKRKDFARWQARECLPDSALCKAVREMEDGLVDADLGGCLFKKRVARQGAGKSGGYRTLLAARIGRRHVFLHGFAKHAVTNISPDSRKHLQFEGKVLLSLSVEDVLRAVKDGKLLEVFCGEQDH